MADRILIADDDADVCSLMTYVLESAGYEVFICNNGRNVIDMVKAEYVKLLILDVMLPGIDGYNIVKKMSDDADVKEVPILVVSALEASKNLFQPFMNVSKFISKPFNNEELVEDVKAALGQS